MTRSAKRFFCFLLLFLGVLYGPIPAYSENVVWDSNGYCWQNCPALDAGAYINSFTTLRGLDGYRALPLVMASTTQIHGLRIGINNPYGNMWTAKGVLIHQSGTRYPIRDAESDDGNSAFNFGRRCGGTNICTPSFSFSGDYTDGWFAGSYSLEITVRYNYNINPTWTKTIILPGAVVILNSPAGIGPTTTTALAPTSTLLPAATLSPVPARPTLGGRCFSLKWTYRNLVCKKVKGNIVWTRK